MRGGVQACRLMWGWAPSTMVTSTWVWLQPPYTHPPLSGLSTISSQPPSDTNVSGGQLKLLPMKIGDHIPAVDVELNSP